MRLVAAASVEQIINEKTIEAVAVNVTMGRWSTSEYVNQSSVEVNEIAQVAIETSDG